MEDHGDIIEELNHLRAEICLLERAPAKELYVKQLYAEYRAKLKRAKEIGVDVRLLKPPPAPAEARPPGGHEKASTLISSEPIPIRSFWRLWNDVAARIEVAGEVAKAQAYILACFSELAYLHVSKFDVDGSERYDFIPSATLDHLLANGIRIDVVQLLERADLEAEIIEREFFTYLIAYVHGEAIIAVRGTANSADWRINLSGEAVRGTGPEYHHGFYAEALAGMRELSRKLVARGGVRAKYLTGHSLGGAIAAIMAQFWDTPTACVFGCPRFGNAVATELRRPQAYIRKSDLVPHIPPRLLGYADLETKPRWTDPTETEVDPDAYKTVLAWMPTGKRFAVQHSIEGYRHQLGMVIGEDFPDLAYISALRLMASGGLSVQG
jgi:hypothetical protein